MEFEDDGFHRQVSRRGTHRGKPTCCSNYLRMWRKLFVHMYPKKMKRTYTKQGRWLRQVIALCCGLHCVFFIITLAFVGFPPMIINLFLAAWSYSIYLTLREWTTVVYFFLLVLSISAGITDIMYDTTVEAY